MKIIFFLIPLFLGLSISLIPNSFAEIEHGINYDKEILQTNPDGSQKIKWTSMPERILVNGIYKEYHYTNFADYMQIETQYGSVILNKSTCSFDFYNKGFISGSPLFSDSIVPKMANDGSNNWNEITQITSSPCETYYHITDNALVSKKYASGIGFIEYKYIFNNGQWKTQLEATNLSSFTDKKFGFTQTINLNRDTISWGNNTKNLDNFDQQTFDRTFLENNESKVMNLLNDFYYDLDLAFPMLESVYVENNGQDKSKLSFNFFHNANILMPNETLIIDPTFGYTTGTHNGVQSNGGACINTQVLADIVGSSANQCYINTAYWDITTIPDTVTITDVRVRYDTANKVGSITSCDWNSIEGNLSTQTTQQRYDDARDGTLFATDTQCDANGSNYVTDLGGNANTDLQNELAVDNEWGVGVEATNNVAGNHYTDLTGIELEVTYITTPPPWAVTDLTSTAIGQTTATLDWTQPYLGGGGQYLLGYQINVTTPQTNNPLVHTNNTGTTASIINLSGLTIGTSYSARISAWTNNTGDHPFNNATGNVYNFTTSTFTPPSAPTLSALSESETSVRFISINGTTGQYNMFYYGLRCVENSLAPWVTIVSNSTTPNPRIYSYTLTPGDYVTCQWRDGSFAGFGDWSNNATETTGQIGIIQAERSPHADKLKDFETWISDEGGLYFGMGVFPMVIMIIGFMATKATVRIFTLISLMSMGILHASGYFVYPTWYWTLAVLFGIVLVLGRQARD